MTIFYRHIIIQLVMRMKPFFSIIVPIYNIEAYIKKCIDSILAQTYDNYELILVDDGSVDQCPAICDAYKKEDTRIQVIHKPNGGLVSARNAGLKIAKGTYICYIDGDDWVAPQLLDSVYHKAIAPFHPDMIVFESLQVFPDKTKPMNPNPEEGFYTKEQLVQKIYPTMMYDPGKPFCTGLLYPAAWNKIYKRELLSESFCREERIRIGEDHAFVWECLCRATSIYFLNEELYFYNRQNADSMTSSYYPEWFRNNKRLADYLEKRLGSLDTGIDLSPQLNVLRIKMLFMGIFHDVRHTKNLWTAAQHIHREIKATGALNNISGKGLPLSVRGYLLLLKCHLYLPAAAAAKIAISV